MLTNRGKMSLSQHLGGRLGAPFKASGTIGLSTYCRKMKGCFAPSLAGHMDLRGELLDHRSRMEFIPFQDFINLLSAIGSTEINIVPLRITHLLTVSLN
jgi:hypothetical protein